MPPTYHTPCAKDLVEAYDEARDRIGTLDHCVLHLVSTEGKG